MQSVLIAVVFMAAGFSPSIDPAPKSDAQSTAQLDKRPTALTKAEGDPPPRDRHHDAQRMVACLQTVRSQIALYQNQHNDKLPNLFVNGWDQLTGETDREGRPPEAGEIAYGPYLQRDATNPLSGSSTVCSMDWIDPEAGWAYDLSTGRIYAVVSEYDAEKFDLDTRNDVLIYREADTRLVTTVTDDLAVLRNAIDLFAVEHGGTYPDAEDITDQITLYTDARGNVSPTKKGNFIYGPYLRRVPSNIVTGSDTICPTYEGPTLDAGWAYDESTGKIRLIVDRATSEGQKLAEVLPNDVLVCEPQVVDSPDGE